MVRKCRKAKGAVEGGVGVSSTYMQLRSRRIVYRSVADNNNNGVSSSSCCASNNNNGVIDLEEEETETSTYRRSGKRKLFENLREKESSESMENSPKMVAGFEFAVKESSECCCSGRRSLSTTEEKGVSTTEQPRAYEIEEFFVEAEKQLHDKFKNKYNFDFQKEKPLEGRYEWVKLSE